MTQIVTNQQTCNISHDEQILVIKRVHLFRAAPAWHGLKRVDFDHYVHIIDHKKEFHSRSVMEVDPVYKQIIPYLVFLHNDQLFLMQRKSTASEQRLRNKMTLGIGGHIRKEDMTTNSLSAWAMREFHEEVAYNGSITIESFGVINDDSDDVGKVHIGFVLLLKGDSEAISVKSELKGGTLVSIEECLQQRECMESWSQYVLDELVARRQKKSVF